MITTSLIVLGGMGLILGLGLSIADKKLSVPVDPRQKEILDALPSANCGVCSFPGCSGYAEAIVMSGADVNRCPVGGAAVAEAIAGIMGVEAAEATKTCAFVKCQGDNEICAIRSEYYGIHDCRAAHLVGAGNKPCVWGCLGMGSCVSACPFDAITMDKNGLPVVNEDLCTSCGKCVEACPRDIIQILPTDVPVLTVCSNCDKGAGIRKMCKLGCTACGVCAKVCPEDAIVIEGNLPVIDYDKCTACGKCAEKCPTNAMVML